MRNPAYKRLGSEAYRVKNIGRAKFLISLVDIGCRYRDAKLIVVRDRDEPNFSRFVEQIGVFDNKWNDYNERVVGLNFDRYMYWVEKGADVTRRVSMLLQLGGLQPITEETEYMVAHNLQYPDRNTPWPK